MSIVSEFFDKALVLESDQQLSIRMRDMEQLNSYRTMLYREKKAFEVKTGDTCHLQFIKERRSDGLYLVIKAVDSPQAMIENAKLPPSS